MPHKISAMWPTVVTVFHDRPKLKHAVLLAGPLVHTYEFKFSQVQVSGFFASVHSFSFLFFFPPCFQVSHSRRCPPRLSGGLLG